MSDYKRLVAYIYLYHNENRTKNIGFTKVESRNGECRIQIHIKGAWTAEGVGCRAYIFYRAGEDIRGVYLGEFRPKNGEGELRLVTASDDIQNSGKELNDMAGIVILSEKEDLFATRWDDGPVCFERFRIHDSFQEQKAEGRPKEETREAEAPVQAAAMAAAVPQETAIPEHMPGDAQGREPVPSDAPGQQPRRQEGAGREGSQFAWKRIFKGREHQKPFGDEDKDVYVYGEPQDLLELGTAVRPLVNNSFLLHGFYSYGHLLLGKRASDGVFLLGVPGEFYVQEKIMASLFGFQEFRKIESGYEDGENVGYWLRELE